MFIDEFVIFMFDQHYCTGNGRIEKCHDIFFRDIQLHFPGFSALFKVYVYGREFAQEMVELKNEMTFFHVIF